MKLFKIGCTKKLEDEMMKLCEKNSPECKTCIGKNCNREKSFTTCLHCATSDDPQCAINPIKVHRKICSAYKDECFTYIGTVGVSRGCLSERSRNFYEDCQNNPEKCSTCFPVDGACNNESIAMETCFACDSISDPNCRTNPTAMKEKICSGLEEKPRGGCYLRVETIKVKFKLDFS